MDLSNEMVALATWLLVAARIAAAVLLVPWLGFAGLPPLLRLAVALVLAFAIVPAVTAVALPPHPAAMALLFCQEVVVGAALGFGLIAIGGALSFGGRLLDYQVGFSAGSLLNPLTRTMEPLTGTLLLSLAGVLFFVLDWHHVLLRGLSYSFVALPPGQGSRLDVGALLRQFGLVLAMGLTVAAPLLFILFATDVAVAVASRSLPQFNIYFVALPLKAGVALILLALASHPLQRAITTMFEAVFEQWPAILGDRT